MHYQILVAVGRHTPIQAPFQHRHGLGDRQTRKGGLPIKRKSRERLDPTADTRITHNLHMKIGKGTCRANVKVRVHQGNVIDQRSHVRSHSRYERSHMQQKISTIKQASKRMRGKVRDFQTEVSTIRPISRKCSKVDEMNSDIVTGSLLENQPPIALEISSIE